MADLSIQDIAETGLVASYAGANSNETIAAKSDERTFLHVKNGDASPTTVTITAQTTSVEVPGVGTLTIADLVVVVAAGVETFIGPLTQAYIGSDGKIDVAYSNTTSITAAAIRMPTSTE